MDRLCDRTAQHESGHCSLSKSLGWYFPDEQVHWMILGLARPQWTCLLLHEQRHGSHRARPEFAEINVSPRSAHQEARPLKDGLAWTNTERRVSASSVERIEERKEIKRIDVSIAIEIRSRVAGVERVQEGEEVKRVNLTVAVEISRARRR